jgi:deazaflavin-dependent oxidoreductase (nitroreductase family)
MAKTYRVGTVTRAINAVFRTLTRLGLGARYRYILGVRGRKTGQLRETPVDVMKIDRRRFLVAGYGVSSWVYNVRAAGEVRIKRGRRCDWGLRARELPPEESVPVLRKYYEEIRVTRPYFDVTLDSSDEEFAREADNHPVFELLPAR